MSESCAHRPQMHFSEFLKRYFKKDGVLMQTFRCKNCGADIRFVKRPIYTLWDALIWVALLAVMFLARILKDDAAMLMAPWLYILLAVAVVSLLGLVLDMAKEWLLMRHGRFVPAEQEPASEEGKPKDGEPEKSKDSEDKPGDAPEKEEPIQ